MSRNRDYLGEIFGQHGWVGPDPDEDLVEPGWRWIGLYDFSESDSVDPEPIEVIREELDRFTPADREGWSDLPRAYEFHRLHFDFSA
jgi:hypothetical protein